MALARLQDQQGNLIDEEEESNYGGGGSAPVEIPEVPELPPEPAGPPMLEGSKDRPREIQGPGRDVPTTPLPGADVRERTPQSTSSAASPDDSAGYTPTRPKSPTPVASAPPAPFSPMAPQMDPGAMTVAMRAPFMPSPTAQYGGGPSAGALLGSQEGLLGGGLGVGGDDSFEDLSGEDPLDALIRILMNGQA